eukprot:scaffold8993_cov207-Skeletonema_marinoi.AAC.8
MSLLRYHKDRLATQHILEDLEAQSPRRTHSWRPDSLHANLDEDELEEEEFEVEYDDGVMQIDNISKLPDEDEARSDAKGGEGVVKDGSSSSSSSGGEVPTYAPTYTPTGGLVESVAVNNETNPTYAPTSVGSLFSSTAPTASPVVAVNLSIAEDDDDGGNETLVEGEISGNFTNGTLVVDENSTSITEDDLFFDGNATTNEITPIEEVVDELSLETNDNTTSSSSPELTETNSTIVVVASTDDGSLFVSTSSSGGEASITEAAIEATNTTTDANTTKADATTTTTTEGTTTSTTEETTTSSTTAATTTSTTTEFTTTTSTTEPTTTSTTEFTTTTSTTEPATTTEDTTTTTTSATVETTTTASPHLCTGTTSGKIFKIDITPTSSTTSLELLTLQNEKKDEYKLVTTYPADGDELEILEVGVRYVKKLCIVPGVYKFVIGGSDGACYKGFLRGVMIFEECVDGEYEFEL